MTVAVEVVERSSIRNLIEDLTEVEQQQMDACLAISYEVFAGFIDSKLACVWGLVPPSLLSERAYLWLYTTPLVDENKFLFVRHSQVYLQKMLELYPEIVGYCKPDNPQAMRWLKWLGAEFEPQSVIKTRFTIRQQHG